ncbi:MAG: hydantoinase/oxoprolinase family protein [Alphaproteobacteria bacterium]|nr:hydantoinase/oxoprolinase family protein [Alphaproteobacteria bacterium]
MIKIAIESGGTFTDLIWSDKSGNIGSHKVPSTPDDPSRAVINGIREAVGERFSDVKSVLHGSTVATNAVIERRGCRAALLVTQGFRDLLLIQRQLRPNVYAIECRKPEPLISLERIIEVSERIGADGSIVTHLDEGRLKADLQDLMEREKPEAIAICLLHSYRNADHETAVAELVRSLYPDLPVVVSSSVLPTFREYERASTTVMAAYLAPLVGRYLKTIEKALDPVGARLFVMQSSGGVLPAAGLGERGVEMLNSGPAAGVIAATSVAQRLGDEKLITLDIGGTSADVCLITQGAPGVRAETEIDGLPVGMPTIDIANVGAGGGSIGWVDKGGMLQVGPQSAGAQPGPACYGRGGTQPAVTDALVALGWIRPETFLGGRMTLQTKAAHEALSILGDSLSLSDNEVAEAIVAIATANVSRGVRLVSVQRGHDPKQHALYAFGGMGPMIAALAAEDLGISRIVVPPHPGLFSALGLLVADIKRVYRETALRVVDEQTADHVSSAFARLEAAAIAEFQDYGVAQKDIKFEWVLEMRYVGQGFETQIPVDPGLVRSKGSSYLTAAFQEAHAVTVGQAPSHNGTEIVTYQLVARQPTNTDVLEHLEPSPECIPEGHPGHVQYRGEQRDCMFYRRDTLPPEFSLTGCAVIEEPTSTTFVPPGWGAKIGTLGAIELTKEAGR